METFALGALGALAPEAIRLYKLRMKLPRLSMTYYAISLIYAAFAGAFALYLAEPQNVASALYVGAGFPSIVAAARRVAEKTPPTTGTAIEENEVARSGLAAEVHTHFVAL